jgi:hypothetical protein
LLARNALNGNAGEERDRVFEGKKREEEDVSHR